jgi:MFS family permease
VERRRRRRSPLAKQTGRSWLPLIAVVTTQMLLVLNVTALKVSIDGIVTSFDVSSSTIKTVIVVYSLVVAALIVLGARVDEKFGPRRMFRAMLILFAAAMLIMACSPGPLTMVVAQILAGAASGALLPSFVMLIAGTYGARQRTTSLSWLAAAQAMSIVPALAIAGALAMWPGWRSTFALIAVLALVIYRLSDALRPVPNRGPVGIDGVGMVLATLGIFLIGVGCNNVTDWGALRAAPSAPFALLQLSPVPFAILGGALFVKAFLMWSRHHHAAGGTPLIALEAFSTRHERATLFSMFTIGVLSSAMTYVIPLYIEVVQGRSTLYTALALVPFALASFVSALLVVRLRVRANRVACYSFLVFAIGAALLGATIRNQWSDLLVIVGMLGAGAGEGALATLLFKLLVASAVRKPESDFAPLCGSADYLAAAVGTALSSALVIGVLANGVHRELAGNELIPASLKAQLDLDDVSFIGNDKLRTRLSVTTATPDQIDEALRINTQARLDALRLCFFSLAGVALLAFFPARALPAHPR